MEKVFVGNKVTILNGKCAGISGTIVGTDSIGYVVKIRVDDETCIETKSYNIKQESEEK